MFCLRFVALFLAIQGLFATETGYYWREYTGRIPEDAIIGGQDINGNDTYIGQAYIDNQGLIVAEIVPGNAVKAPVPDVKTATYVKILCGKKNNFYWLESSFQQLHVDTTGKLPVIGGHQDGGRLYVGRFNDEGNTVIGKILAYSIENASLHYVNNWSEKVTNYYEVLLVNSTFTTN